MIIESVRIVKTRKKDRAIFIDSGKGYIQGSGAALPDIDTDYQGDRRMDVKSYLEERYNKNNQTRVYSAGTFTTLKAKAVIKDIGKNYKVPFAIRNYITAMIDDADISFTDLFKLAWKNKKIRDFINKYPNVIEDIRTILDQPKASSIHASAVIVTPAHKDGKEVDCFDFTPIKKVDGLLVSEFSGYDLDELGFLKTDVLNTVELTKVHKMFDLIEAHYGEKLTLEKIESELLNDPKVYQNLSAGNTINVFQFSSAGMTKLMMDMKPSNIDDLIALNAMYRPATIALGTPEAYIRAKHGDIEPQYLWGTYDILKKTYGQLCVAGGTLVKTNIGNVKIEDIKVGDLVQTEDGSYQKVLRTFDQGVKRTLKVITSNNKEVICTPDHKILTQDGWVRADELDFCHKIKGFSMSKNDTSSYDENGNHLCWENILKIEKHKAVPTYDISVETNHSFVANGLVISNCYQEQMSEISQIIGGFSKSESVALVKLISKKKVDKIIAMKDKFMAGAEKNGCPKEDADKIWEMFEVAGTYSFNLSHSTCYAILGYVGAWLKTHYPAIFYTVALQYEKDEDQVKNIMSEMERSSNCMIVPPDINKAGLDFETDYDQNLIFWSLLKIKNVGVSAVEAIIDERNKNGDYKSLSDFLERIANYQAEAKLAASVKGMRYTSPVNARTVRHLIYAGCFDNVLEGFSKITDRKKLLEEAQLFYPDIIKRDEIPEDKDELQYVWAKMQIKVSTLGNIDYKRIFDDNQVKHQLPSGSSYMSVGTALDLSAENSKIYLCATIAEATEMGYNDKQTGERKVFGKVIFQQNNDTIEMVIWQEVWLAIKNDFLSNIGKIVAINCFVKYNARSGGNNLQASKASKIITLN